MNKKHLAIQFHVSERGIQRDIEMIRDFVGYIIQAEVFGDGIDMWLRGQGEWVKEVNSKII